MPLKKLSIDLFNLWGRVKMEEKQLGKVYNPKDVEDKIYENWCKNNYFHAKIYKCYFNN